MKVRIWTQLNKKNKSEIFLFSPNPVIEHVTVTI